MRPCLSSICPSSRGGALRHHADLHDAILDGCNVNLHNKTCIPPCVRNILVQEGLCRPEKQAGHDACHQANLFRQVCAGQLHGTQEQLSLQAGRPLQAGLCRPIACSTRTVEPASKQTFAGRPVQAKSTRILWRQTCVGQLQQQERYKP